MQDTSTSQSSTFNRKTVEEKHRQTQTCILWEQLFRVKLKGMYQKEPWSL